MRTLSIKEPDIDRSHIQIDGFQPSVAKLGSTITLKKSSTSRASRDTSLEKATDVTKSAVPLGKTANTTRRKITESRTVASYFATATTSASVPKKTSSLSSSNVAHASRLTRSAVPVTPSNRKMAVRVRPSPTEGRHAPSLNNGVEDEDDEQYDDEEAEQNPFDEHRRTSSKGQSALRPRTTIDLPLEPPSPLADIEMADSGSSSGARIKRRLSGKDGVEVSEGAHRFTKKKCSFYTIPYRPTTSTRPNGIWHCYIPACDWKIYGANEADNQAKIHCHLRSHQEKLVEAAELISDEAGQGLYPVEYVVLLFHLS